MYCHWENAEGQHLVYSVLIVNSFAEWAYLLSLRAADRRSVPENLVVCKQNLQLFGLIFFRTVLMTDSEEVGHVIDD
jgi:hypothetical protein